MVNSNGPLQAVDCRIHTVRYDMVLESRAGGRLRCLIRSPTTCCLFLYMSLFFSQAFITRASSIYFSIGLVWSVLIILHSGHVPLPSVGAVLILIYMRLPYSYFSRFDFVVEGVHLF